MKPRSRRSFLKASAVLGCGLGAGGFSSPSIAGVVGGASRRRIEHHRPAQRFLTADWHTGFNVDLDAQHNSEPVQGLTVTQLDYLHDPKANSIGALLLHLAAIERLYQLHTFEGRKWDDWDEMTVKEWGVPAGLGKAARQTIRGHELAYYLDRLREGREHTLAELRKRDDTWLMQIDNHWPWGPTNNYCKWFHVCEHESNHNGQIKWLKGRLPEHRSPKPANLDATSKMQVVTPTPMKKVFHTNHLTHSTRL